MAADIRSMARGALDTAEGDESRAGVDVLGESLGLQAAVVKRDLADLVALAGQLPPREVVRAVLLLADHDVLGARCLTQLRGHQACRGRHRRDQRNIRPVRTHQSGHRRSGVLGSGLPADEVEAVRRPLAHERVVGVRHRPARQPHRGSVEVRPLLRRRVEPARSSYVHGALRDRIAGHESDASRWKGRSPTPATFARCTKTATSTSPSRRGTTNRLPTCSTRRSSTRSSTSSPSSRAADARSSSGSGPAGSRCRSRGGECPCTGSSSRRRWPRGCARSRAARRSASRSATSRRRPSRGRSRSHTSSSTRSGT